MREVQRSYGAVAALYTRLFGSTESVHSDDLALLARSFDAGPILDLGCGPGHLTAYLCDLGLDARGVDLVPEFIDHARASRPDVRYDVGSMVDVDCDS